MSSSSRKRKNTPTHEEDVEQGLASSQLLVESQWDFSPLFRRFETMNPDRLDKLLTKISHIDGSSVRDTSLKLPGISQRVKDVKKKVIIISLLTISLI